MFSGPYDAGSAILSISAGAGGTEATDWAEMLLRMYLRWADPHHFKTEVVDEQEGEQAGIKSATIEVDGRYAYGFLRAERGVHRLVRISPFDAQNRRQTTFALVEVMPEAEDDIEIELDWDEIRVDTYRSQGAGGQHVNKTDSAVRLTHLPTGIVAQSQNERSQTQNKETAIKVLKARLLERALEEKEAQLRALKGEHVEAGWGNQIRSYVLHPYQMVKDLRTELRDEQHDGRPRRRPRCVHARRARARGDRRRAGRGPRRRVSRASGTLPAALIGIAFRPARSTDLPECAAIWRESINDYLRRLHQEEMPDELGPIGRLHGHAQSTDPDRFVVATTSGAKGERILGFGSAIERGPIWYLSMLFIRPAAQGQGLGRAILERLLPDPEHHGSLATAVDSLQPISTALYASATGSRRGCRSSTCAVRSPGPRRSPHCRPASSRSRSTRSLPGRPAGTATASWPTPSTRSTASCSAPSIRTIIASSAPRAAGLPLSRSRRGRARLRLRRRGRPGRADRRARRGAARPGRRPPRRSGPGPRGAFGLGARRRRRGSCRPCSAAGLRIDGFPLVCAGTARSPTSAATCRSRPGCSDPRPGDPSRLRSKYPCRGRAAPPVVASALTWLLRSCPRSEPDAREAPAPSPDRRLGADRDRRPLAGRRRALAPRPPRRPWPRPRRRSERAVLVLHDVTKTYPNGKTALATSTSSIPEGDFVFLVGPSGAGKSTLIKLLIRDEIATQWRRRPRRPGPGPAAAPPGAQGPAQDRDRLPGLQAAARQDGLGERRVRARGHRHAAQEDPAGRRPRARARRPTAQAPAARTSCRAASSSGRRSPGPSSTTRA